MKVSFPKKSKLDVLSTYESLNAVLRVFNLSCIFRDGTNLKWSWPIWKISLIMTTVIAVNGLTIYTKIQNFNTDSITQTFKELVLISYLISYQQYIIDLSLVYKFGRQRYVDYLNQYKVFDNVLGTCYYRELKTSIRNLCYFFTAITVITETTDYIAWSVHIGSTIPAIYMIDYVYIIVKMLSVLDMISNYTQMWYRLKALADTLEDYYFHCENIPGIAKYLTNRTLSTIIHLDYSKSIRFNRLDIIADLPRLYLLLIEQCDYLNMKHGIRIIVNSVTLLLDMVLMTNLLIRLIMGTLDIPQNTVIVPIISTIIRIISCSAFFVTGIYRCEQSYRQNERILQLIDRFILFKRISFEVRENFKELKNLLLTKAVKYHTMNFYKLEYATLVSISSVVVTYTIILMQSIK